MAQHNLGQVYRNLGDYRRAVACYQKNVACLHGELLRECFGLPGLASVISRSFLTLSLAECGAFAEGGLPPRQGCSLPRPPITPTAVSRRIGLWAFGRYARGTASRPSPVLERALDLAQGAPSGCSSPESPRSWGLPIRLPDGPPTRCRCWSRRSSRPWPCVMLDHALRVAWLSEAYLLAGRLDEAYTQAQHALEFSRAHQERGHEAYALRLLGEFHARHDPQRSSPLQPTTARPSPWPRRSGMRPLQAHCHLALAPCIAREDGWSARMRN